MTNIIKLHDEQTTNPLALDDKYKFDVGLEPIYYFSKEINGETKEGALFKDANGKIIEGTFKEIPNHYQVWDTTNQRPIPNGVVGSKYHPTAIYELMDNFNEGLVRANLDTGCVVKDAMYEGGAKFVRTISYPNITIEPKTRKVGDIIRFEIVFRTSLDGSWVHSLQILPIRLLCLNGMVGVDSNYKLIFNFKHTTGFNPSVIRDKVMIGQESFQEMQTWFESLSNAEVTTDDVKALLKQTLFKKQAQKDAELKENKTFNWMMEQFLRETKDLGMTMWAVYNMLTHYATHTPLRRSNTPIHSRVVTDQQQIMMVMRSPQWHRLVA
jgi:hypothetical protein